METIHNVSRRNFVKGAAGGAALAAGVAGVSQALANPLITTVTPDSSSKGDGDESAYTGGVPSFMVAPDPIPSDQITDTLETEVLIIGGGIAGSVTASSCVENGLKVIMIERNEQSRAVGKDFGFVNPQCVLDEACEELDPYILARDFVVKSANRVCGDVVYRFMSRSGEAGNWWTAKNTEWGYHPVVQGYSSNSDFYRNYTHVAFYYPESGQPEGRYDVVRDEIDHMAQEVIDAGGQYLTKTEAVQLLKDEDGRVTGAVCTDAEGNYIQINASNAVVLATGDYGGDDEMFDYYTGWKRDLFDLYTAAGTGAGHKMGLWVGAQMQEAPHPMMIFRAYSYHYLRTNKHGKRYCNEDNGYPGAAVAQLRQPDQISWAIWDDKWKTELPASLAVGGGMSWDQDFRGIHDEWTVEREEETALSWEREDGLLLEADTLDELADKMGYTGTDKENFLATVERYNTLAEGGEDKDFGKRPELMTPIVQAPFYALKMTTQLAVTVGGLITDVDGNVLDNDGVEIPGLYAIGTVTGTLFGVDYNEVTVPGISMARNVTFGWLMGKHLAGVDEE